MESKIREIIDLLINKIDEEFTLKGHPNTGAFQESLSDEVKQGENKLTIDILANEYGLYLSEGVTPDRVPYSRGRGRGGTSKYITGLKNWVQSKLGIGDEREALGIAFAIASSHLETGYPVVDGELGSGFLKDIEEKFDDELTKLIEEYYDLLIEKQFKEI